MQSLEQVIDLVEAKRFGEIDGRSLFSALSGARFNEIFEPMQEWATQTQTTITLQSYLDLLTEFIELEDRPFVFCFWFVIKGNEVTANKIVNAFLNNDDLSWPSVTDDQEINSVKDFCSDKNVRSFLLGMWLKKPENDLTEAQLQRCHNVFENIFIILASWVAHGKGIERVNKALLLIDTDRKGSLIKEWVKEGHVFSTIEAVSTFLEQSDNDDSKSRLVNQWLCANGLKKDNAPIAELLSHVHDIAWRNIIVSNMLYSVTENLPLERFIVILSNAYGRNRYANIEKVYYYLKHRGREAEWPKLLALAETVEDQDKLIKTLGLQIERPPIIVAHTIEHWIDQLPDGYDPDEFSNILGMYHESRYESIAQHWFQHQTTPISYESLKQGFEKQGIQQIPVNVFSAWAERNTNDDAFCDLISKFPVDQKCGLVSSRIRKQSDDNSRYAVFLKWVQLPRLELIYHPRSVLEIMRSLDISLQKITEISSILYPNNDISRSVLFHEATKHVTDQKQLKEMLLEFIKTLKEDEVFTDIYNVSNEIKNALSSLEWLTLADNKVAEKYATLKQFLDYPIEKALTADGLTAAKAYFKDELTGKHLSALFMFFDLIDKTELLRQWMNEDLLKEIVSNFSPPFGSPYLTAAEHHKLFSLGIPALPSMQLLCDVLQKRTPKVPSVEESIAIVEKMEDDVMPTFPKVLVALVKENKEYHVQRKSLEDELFKLMVIHGSDLEHPDIVAKNEALEKLDTLHQSHVIVFFEHSMQLEDRIKPYEGKKLFRFFDSNLSSVLYIFSHPDGRTNFRQFLYSLGEGCVANIGTQARIATNDYLFKDDVAGRVLYACFAEKIVAPIFSTGDKLGASASGSDPFTNMNILECAISPPGLVAALVDSYYSQGKLAQVAWAPIREIHTLPLIKQKRGITDEFLKELKETNEDEFDVLMASLTDAANGYHLDFMDDTLTPKEKNGMSVDEKAARFLVFLTLRALLPDVLAHASLEPFKKENEGYLNELNNAISLSESPATTQPLILSQASSESAPSSADKSKPDRD